jgi:threonine dehydratase/serine racemase
VTPEDVRAAADRIRGAVHRTPVLTSRTLNGWSGRSLFFKCENLQRVGAFKIRGATNAVRSLSAEGRTGGVVTHSSGNHAAALALAAREAGVACVVVMPDNAPEVKRAAVLGYGAEVLSCRPTQADRERAAAAVVSERGMVLVHSFDDPAVIAGQGTAALELLDEVPDLDAVVVPIGGGGLCSGTVLAVDGRCDVFAAEPLGADDAARSVAAGERLLQADPRTVADGLRTSLGLHTWPIIRRGVREVVTVSDDAILDAMHALWQRTKLVVEPSGAVGLAAVLSDRMRGLQGLRRVGVVLTGGNVALPLGPTGA